MRIWFPLATLLSVGWLLLVSVLVSRGGGSSGAQASDADRLLQQSQEAMRELDSFQFQLSTLWEGRELTYRITWQSPDSFHALSPYLTTDYQSGEVPVITDYGFVEWIAAGDALYGRQCAAEGEGCQPWQERPRGDVYLPAPAPELDPFWAVEILGLMSDAQIVGQEEVEGVVCTRIQGRANLLRAMTQSWRYAEETRGPMSWGEECTSEASESGGETQEECRDITLDEYIAKHEDSLREQEENPLSAEVWIGQDDKLLRRLDTAIVSGEQPGSGSFTLSQFNEVAIQPPQ